jgi:DNA-binding response OmpR family regulator
MPLTPVLRVRRAAAEVQWDGRSVILSRQIFPVFERLLEKALSRDQVASGAHVEGTTAREAKDLIRELRDAFKAAGFTNAESKALIATVRNRGYRLGVYSSDIVVDD